MKNRYNFKKKITIGRKERKLIIVGIIIIVAILMLLYPILIME